MEQFKCRASGAGQLMTNPRGKNETISATAKTFIQTWCKEAIYGVRKEISSKYLTKGLEMEDTAIDKAIEWLDLPFVLKNETRYTDEFFTGEPDLILMKDGKPYEILDIKNSWDCFSFPLFEKELPTDDYYYQLQVYMHLTGARKAAVVYVLLNTPETFSTPEIDYSNVPKEKRIKRYDFEYDEKVIEDLKTRIINARNYIKDELSIIN